MKESALDECWLDRSGSSALGWLGVRHHHVKRRPEHQSCMRGLRVSGHEYISKNGRPLAQHTYYCTVVLDRT